MSEQQAGTSGSAEQQNAGAEEYVLNHAEVDKLEVVMGALESIFSRSFQDFTIFWEDNCIPRLDEREVPLHAVFDVIESVSLELRTHMISQLKLFLEERFIRLRVRSYMIGESDGEEFLDLFAAFIEYFKKGCRAVEALFTSVNSHALRNRLGNRTVFEYLRYYGLRELYLGLQGPLRRTSINRIKKFREGFRYTSKWSYSSFATSPFADVTVGFKEFFSTADYSQCKEDFKYSALDHVDTLVVNIDNNISEKTFLGKRRGCLYAERLMFNNFYGPPDYEKQLFLDLINNKFCHVHAEKEQTGAFQNYCTVLLTPEIHFDNTVFYDLFMMYIFYESDFKDSYARRIAVMIRKTFTHIFLRNAPSHYLHTSSVWPLEGFQLCLHYLDNRDKLVRQRMNSNNTIRHLVGIQKLYLRASAELIFFYNNLNPVHYSNIAEAQTCAVQYLCSLDGEEETQGIRLTLIALFFRFLANQGMFMNKLLEKIQSEVLNNQKVNLSRLLLFKEMDYVKNHFSGEILTLINDIHSNERDALETEFRDSNGSIKFKSSSVFKEADWKALKDKENLLIHPEELIPIRNRAESRLRTKLGSEKKIRPINALAAVTIKTRLFTKERQFTRITLLVYQAMVLKLFQHNNSIPMADIYHALIRYDIPMDSNQRAQAEDVIHRLVNSLIEPYCMLVTAFDPETPDPSRLVYVNSSFFFEEEEVSLIGQNLVQAEVEYDP